MKLYKNIHENQRKIVKKGKVKMKYIPPEILAEVKKIDLFTYLKTYEPNELEHVARQ